MHDRSPNRIRVRTTGSQSEAKPLFRNILQISPCESGFYPYLALSQQRNFMKIRILEDLQKKILRHRRGTNKKADHEVCPNLLVEEVTSKAT